MIDMSEIVARITKRIAELGTNETTVSLSATDSRDTIRNWRRAVEADQKNGTITASATVIKLNQVEDALGIELARNSIGAQTPEAQLRSSLLAFGVDRDEMDQVIRIIGTYVSDDETQEQTSQEGQSQPASRRRVTQP